MKPLTPEGVAEWEPTLITAALRSRCTTSRRGVILIPLGRGPDPRSAAHSAVVGYNRPAIGSCDGSPRCERDCGKICTHAEEAAVLDAGWQSQGAEVLHLKITAEGAPVVAGSPSCVSCSRLMLFAGVAGVWLFTATGWRRWTAEAFHEETLRTLDLFRSAP